MAFKTGGRKTKYIEEAGYHKNEYTLYCAVESVSDICVYKMFDSKGNERDITVSAEDDADGYGNHSLIDCLYYLKQGKDKTYKYSGYNIVIEDMTPEEMQRLYGR